MALGGRVEIEKVIVLRASKRIEVLLCCSGLYLSSPIEHERIACYELYDIGIVVSIQIGGNILFSEHPVSMRNRPA